MITIVQGESLQVPATVTGDKSVIDLLSAEIKKSNRGEVPLESATTIAELLVTDYTSAEITDGYMFTLADTSDLTVGIYYINYKYTIDGKIYKGAPMRVTVRESVI